MSDRTARAPPTPGKPGRPTADQAAAISRAILSAAADCFSADGFDGASMEAIAVRTGVPKSTVYKRYPDKRALLRAVIEARVAAWSSAAAEQNWMLTEDLGQRLKYYAAWLLARGSSPEVRTFASLAASAWSGADETLSRLDVVGFSGMVDLLEHDIRAFGPRTGIEARDPRQVAMILMAMLAGWLELRASTEQATEAEAAGFADVAVELMLRGSAAW